MNEFPVTPSESRDALEENYQARISALLDGELPQDQLIATLDYLVATPGAQRFYRQARALEGLLAAADSSSAREVTRREHRPSWRDLEERLETADQSDDGFEPPGVPEITHHRARKSSFTSSAPVRLFFAAAAGVLILMIGLSSWQVWQNGGAGQELPEIAQLDSVTVGARAGEMTDGRFLDLAREILESDRRYRLEMLALMSAVDEQPLVERTTEESRPVSERRGESTRDYDESDFDNRSEHLRNRPQVKLW